MVKQSTNIQGRPNKVKLSTPELSAYYKLLDKVKSKGFTENQALIVAEVSEASYGSYQNAMDDFLHIEMRLAQPDGYKDYEEAVIEIRNHFD